MGVKSLQDEFVTLKTAIEGAINEGQKSLDHLNDIPRPGMVFNKDSVITYRDGGSGVVGWVDDF